MIFIKKFLNIFFKNKIIFSTFLVALLINGSIWLNLLRIQKINDLIPLHYNIYLGIDYMGFWYKLFIIPFIGLIILFFNFFLFLFICFQNRIINNFLSFSTLLIQIILLLASFSIVWINT